MRSERLSSLRHLTLGIAVLAMTLLALAVTTSSASAATPCHSVRVEGVKIRVAAVRTSCKSGREVASGYFERTLSGDHFDGKTADGSIYYDIDGFRCLTGLGGSQMYCHHRNRWVYGSTRPKDHPSTWGRRAHPSSAEASPRRVFFVVGCSGSVYQPKEIALTCADGKVRFLADRGWEEWGPGRAFTHGTLRFPDCSPDVPLIACRDYAEDEAILHLWRPVYCPTVGHWQFSRLGVEDLTGPGPEGFDGPIPYPCERFKSEPVHRLGSFAARAYMRSVLARFNYESRAGGSIKCNRRLSATRVGCKMGWVIGDTGYVGRGQIWLTFPHHEKRAHFFYRLTRVDEYCVFVTHEGDCTKRLRDSGAVSG